MGFYNIFTPEGLSEEEYRRALLAGPTYVGSGRLEQSELLRRAGFVAIEEIDLTVDFLDVARGWQQGRLRHADELRKVEGQSRFGERLRDGQAMVAAIEAGLLRRSLFLARRP